ncbi:hypothetical protein AB9F41_34105, partial [Rhizobium leguminosarum]
RPAGAKTATAPAARVVFMISLLEHMVVSDALQFRFLLRVFAPATGFVGRFMEWSAENERSRRLKLGSKAVKAAE